MKHPVLFKWLTRISRFVSWVLLLAALLWTINILKVVLFGAEISRVDALEIEDIVAVPLFASGILVIYRRIRAAFGTYILFVIGALALIELSLESILVCVVLGLLLFSPLLLINNQHEVPHEQQ